MAWLVACDESLARIARCYGPPPLWASQPGLPTLVRIIFEQQASLASAQAAFERLYLTVSPLTPQGFLTLDDAQLKAIRFSRQKTVYGRELVQAVLSGKLVPAHGPAPPRRFPQKRPGAIDGGVASQKAPGTPDAG